MKGIRYLFYLGFAAGACIFWALFYMLVLGVFPFPAEPECAFDPAGCPPASIWKQLFTFVVVFGTIPLTVILFVFFRRWVRRRVGFQDNF
jgi:hypothetical protein